MKKLILDCYSDEPSGLGAPPYISVHSRYIAGVLSERGEEYIYATIDDLRVFGGERNKYIDERKTTWNKRIINKTKVQLSQNVLDDISEVYIVFGCFIDYSYVSCEPPTFEEIVNFCKMFFGDKTNVLFYSLGANEKDIDKLRRLEGNSVFSEIIVGNTYNYFLGHKNSFLPNYSELRNIAIASASIANCLCKPVIYEIETAIGCNRKPGCTFCIENLRNIPNVSRSVDDIVDEIYELYKNGARYFRLGRQPNFYSYCNKSSIKINELLKKIRTRCPDILMLHIDNVNPQDVVTEEGKRTTRYIVDNCTSGNIGPFGIESFDDNIRTINNLNGTKEEILEAIHIINEYGSEIEDSGLRRYLPGINLIYGLSGQSDNTLSINMKYLKTILDSGDLVRRVFVRKLTSPQGTSLDRVEIEKEEFEEWKTTIEKQFSLPMTMKVYPVGTVIKNAKVEMFIDGESLLRVLGTCAERIYVKGIELEIDRVFDVRVVGYRNSRELIGELVL